MFEFLSTKQKIANANTNDITNKKLTIVDNPHIGKAYLRTVINDVEINDYEIIDESNESIIDNSNDISKSIDSGLMLYTDEAPEDFLIDINSATSEQLQALYRIGPALAQKIIEYRDSYGYFATIEEIKEVSGIGDKTYEKIKDHIKAEQQTIR